MREDIILNICKEIVQRQTGVPWRNFHLLKVEEKRGYISGKTYFNCHVSYVHPNDESIFTDWVAVSPAQIRGRIIDEVLK